MYLTGVYTALITPFKGDAVDVAGLRQLAQRQIAGGVDGVLAFGTTGETPTLNWQEQELILRTLVEECKGKVTVVAGTGSYSTATSVARGQAAEQAGADALLVVTPYYNKPTQRGLFRHFEAVCNAVEIPVIAYNNPTRTGVNIDPLTLREMAELPNLVGIKDCSGDMGQVSDYLHQCSHLSRPFSLVSGDDGNTLPIMALGGRGVFSVLSNLAPERIVQLVQALDQGDFAEGRRLHYQLLPLFKAIFMESNPIPIKEAMNLCGLPAGHCRLPLCEMSEPHRAALHGIIQAARLIPMAV